MPALERAYGTRKEALAPGVLRAPAKTIKTAWATMLAALGEAKAKERIIGSPGLLKRSKAGLKNRAFLKKAVA